MDNDSTSLQKTPHSPCCATIITIDIMYTNDAIIITITKKQPVYNQHPWTIIIYSESNSVQLFVFRMFKKLLNMDSPSFAKMTRESKGIIPLIPTRLKAHWQGDTCISSCFESLNLVITLLGIGIEICCGSENLVLTSLSEFVVLARRLMTLRNSNMDFLVVFWLSPSPLLVEQLLSLWFCCLLTSARINWYRIVRC